MITATDLELRAGARILLEPTTLRVQPGDRIGLVGRNGAGKTTSLRTFAGETLPHAGHDRAHRPGRLPAAGPAHRRPRRAGPRPRAVRPRPRHAGHRHRQGPGPAGRAPRRRGPAAPLRQRSRSGSPRSAATPPRARPPASARTSACPTGCSAQPLQTLSGGQRRRVELARILFADSGAEPTTLLLDEPTNHLDADSIVWLRDFLRQHTGGLVLISHDVGLLDAVVNKVWYLDANRAAVDVYNVGWKTYLQQRETDERRRHRERANAERKIESLREPGRQDAGQGDEGAGGAPDGPPGRRAGRRPGRGAGARQGRPAALPGAGPVRAHPADRRGAVEVLRLARGVHRRRPRRRPRRAGRRARASTAPARRRCCGCCRASSRPTPARSCPGTACGSATTPRSTRPSTTTAPSWRTCARRPRRVGRADLTDTELRKILGAFLFTGDDVDKPAGVLSGGEKTRLALAMLVTSAANVLLLDEPTNNLDPVSREQVLDALRTFAGAIVLVTHDEGAVEALDPEKVILLPDGIEDTWSSELADLITLA